MQPGINVIRRKSRGDRSWTLEALCDYLRLELDGAKPSRAVVGTLGKQI